jgi:hypothetical protein
VASAFSIVTVESVGQKTEDIHDVVEYVRLGPKDEHADIVDKVFETKATPVEPTERELLTELQRQECNCRSS